MDNKINKIPRISDLRKSLDLTLGKELIQEGFVSDKKNVGYKRKGNKGSELRISFDCYDYKPERIEFRLSLVFVLKEIEDEAELYYAFCGEIYTRGWTICLTEGDFHPQVKHLEPKLRNAATHIVTDNETMIEGINDCRQILVNEIFPQLDNFLTLSGFQKFVLNNYDEMLRLGLIYSGLIAAKLHSKEELIKLVDFLWKRFELESKNDIHIMKRLVGKIIEYDSLTTERLKSSDN